MGEGASVEEKGNAVFPMGEGDSAEGKGNAVFSRGKERKALGRLLGEEKPCRKRRRQGGKRNRYSCLKRRFVIKTRYR